MRDEWNTGARITKVASSAVCVVVVVVVIVIVGGALANMCAIRLATTILQTAMLQLMFSAARCRRSLVKLRP